MTGVVIVYATSPSSMSSSTPVSVTACGALQLPASNVRTSSFSVAPLMVPSVWSELERFLKECGVSAVPTEGARFDPNVHQAVFVQPSAEHPDSTVLSEVKPGYVFGEQVLRPAQVVVAKRPKPPHEAEEPEAGEENPLDRAETMEEDGARDTPLDAGGEDDTDGAGYR